MIKSHRNHCRIHFFSRITEFHHSIVFAFQFWIVLTNVEECHSKLESIVLKSTLQFWAMLTNIEERYSKLESIDWRVLSNFEQCLPTLNSALHNALQIWLTLFNLDKHSSKLKEKTFNFGEYSPYFFLCVHTKKSRLIKIGEYSSNLFVYEFFNFGEHSSKLKSHNRKQ